MVRPDRSIYLPTLRKPLSECGSGGCPTVYEIDGDDGNVAVQGYVTAHTDLPDGEAVVIVPRDLLRNFFGGAMPAEVD